jgi:molecular chaperone Hsp33
MKASTSEKDTIQRFLFDSHCIRGEIVRLHKSFSSIMDQHAYPGPIQTFLGETLIAAVSLTSSMKFEGRLTIQFASEGAVKLLVAKCDHLFHVRGLAQWQPDATSDELKAGLEGGDVVVTIQQDDQVKPYQSVVPLEGRSIAKALEHYFNQSEQIPTRFFFAVSPTSASGVLLQMMPVEDSKKEQELLFWHEIVDRFKKMDKELFVACGNEEFLTHFFPEQTIQVFPHQEVSFQCTCSIPRMEDAVRTVGVEEAMALLVKKQSIIVTCQFCNSEYDFGREDIERIFSESKKDF